jgi:hypothetical protein
MSFSTFLLAIWLILLGITWLAWVAISTKFLGAWAAITGIVFLVEAVRPISLPRP